jgi:hypothetical protein
MKKNLGITLIALIITIIVLLILAGVSINLILGDNGVITKAKIASEETKEADAKEKVSMAWASCEMEYQDAWSTNQSVKRSTYFTKEKMNEYLNSEGEITEEFIYNEDDDSEFTYKTSDGTEYMLKVDKTGKVSKNLVVYLKVGEEEVAITKGNLWQYLGREVKNYKGKTTLKIDDTISYTVSETYRLFYIDFDNDYGDGEGTIYLKADILDNYPLQLLSEVTTNNKYLLFNRKWNSKGTNSSKSLEQNNQQAVAWLLEPSVWDGLKTITEGISSDINYVVGAPSLEMYVDSYNRYLTGYNSANETKLQNVNGTEAQKLKYEYVTDSTVLQTNFSSSYNSEGYIIGFEDSDGNMVYGKYDTLGLENELAENGYWTGAYLLISSNKVHGMYNPGGINYYWLASTSAHGSSVVMNVSGDHSSVDAYNYIKDNISLCPIVSLKSTATLTLASE